MCKIVLISQEQADNHKGKYIVKPGDYVDVYEDDIELGSSYDLFTILNVPKVESSRIRDFVTAKMPISQPEQKRWFRSSDNKWCNIIKIVKYPVNFNLSQVDIDTLSDSEASNTLKNVILNKCTDNISDQLENQTVL